MRNSDLEIKRELIQILDDVLAEGVWTGSLFLEASGKKIYELRERLVNDFKLEEDMSAELEHANVLGALSAVDSFPVYIALYQSTGLDIKKWETLLNSIGSFSSGRPIYKSEEDIQSFIRSKENAQNDGYAVVYIQAKDVVTLPANKQLFDRNGKELLMVKEGALQPQKLTRFVHTTGQYQLKDGKLLKEPI